MPISEEQWHLAVEHAVASLVEKCLEPPDEVWLRDWFLKKKVYYEDVEDDAHLNERALKALVCEVAVWDVIKEDLIYRSWVKESDLINRARSILMDIEISPAALLDPKALKELAMESLTDCTFTLVQVLSYNTKDNTKPIMLSISCSLLSGRSFDIEVRKGATVRELTDLASIQLRRMQVSRPEYELALGFQILLGHVGEYVEQASLLGPGGTMLPPARTLPEALDYEMDDYETDGKKGDSETTSDIVCYPLEVLTSERWKELRLDGASRWKYLDENTFEKVFGMGKASFEKLATWKQLSLRKKHGLF